MSQETAFKLKDSFIEKYKTIRPPFGFNGLGELTYMRTYSRLICPTTNTYDFDIVEGKNISKGSGEEMVNEQFWQTIKRVTEGVYWIQKQHILKHRLGWSETKAQRSAEEMYDRMFNMKFLPPGRGLWAMGTSLIHERGLYEALNNCAFVSTKDLGVSIEESTKPFEFLMDMSMLGVGVGFDVKGAEKIKLREYKQEGVFQIPDTREGWVESLKLILKGFFSASGVPEMDYSIVRPAGEAIKTFGGVSSGPEPLRILHQEIINLFKNREGEEITQTDIVDIMNMIGCCVVAGNVRRTAEIVFGEPDSEEYLKLKDYHWNADLGETNPSTGFPFGDWDGPNAKRAAWGWTSNNSVFARVGMDYSRIAKQTAKNGEPGYAWLKNMQKFGRMNSDPIDLAKINLDHRVMGGNPCLEQSLESYELCCLVETFPTMCDDLDDYLRTLKFAYLYAKTVTLGMTSWPETNRVMLRNRRIGTSQSGVAQYVSSNGLDAYRILCDKGYKKIQHYDGIYSEWFCIPRSVKTTSIKPSGTVSLLPGVTPGMHYPESTTYIRRIRIAENSKLLKKCQDAGYRTEADVVSKGTWCIEIPVKIEGVRTVSQVSMWEQLSLASFIQKWWADNQVSSTITFQKHEADQIEDALNYFQYQLKGVSFLPKLEKGIYAQMPYEEITEAKYDEMVLEITDLSFEGVSEDSKPEKYCDSTACEI